MPKKKQRQKKTVVLTGPRGNSGGDRFLANYMNPWSEVKGKKVPDSDASRSISLRARSYSTIPKTSGSTVAAIKFIPRLDQMTFSGPTFTGTTPDFSFPITDWGSGSNITNYSSYTANFDRWRIVTWGIRITSIGPALNTQGIMTISASTDDDGIGPYSPGAFALRKDIYAIQPGLDIVWVSRPLHNRAREYFAVNATTRAESYNWEYPCVFLEGLDTDDNTVLRYEVRMDLEFTPRSSTVMEQMASQAALENLPLLQRLNNAFNRMAGAYNSPDFRDSMFILKGAGDTLYRMYAGAQNRSYLTYPDP